MQGLNFLSWWLVTLHGQVLGSPRVMHTHTKDHSWCQKTGVQPELCPSSHILDKTCRPTRMGEARGHPVPRPKHRDIQRSGKVCGHCCREARRKSDTGPAHARMTDPTLRLLGEGGVVQLCQPSPAFLCSRQSSIRSHVAAAAAAAGTPGGDLAKELSRCNPVDGRMLDPTVRHLGGAAAAPTIPGLPLRNCGPALMELVLQGRP